MHASLQLAFCGNGNETDANYCISVLKMIISLSTGLNRRQIHIPEMQNEMAKVMALRVLRKILANLQRTSFYTVMLDENGCRECGAGSNLS